MSTLENTIVECVFDITFKSDDVAESFIPVISKVDQFDKIVKLPLYQVPENIRKNDPNLKFQPLYEIRSNINTSYKIMLGDSMIGIALNGKYTSWTNSLFPQIKKLFSEILNSGKVFKIERMGLRYVDFLENENIFETGKIGVTINNQPSNTKKMFLRIEDKIDEVDYNKVIVNNVQYQNFASSGSIIDIVTSKNINDVINEEGEFFTSIDKLHDINKDKFKEVISDEYITKYGI